MTSFFKELSVAIGLLGSDQVPVANADGWRGYVWQVHAASACDVEDERGFCEIAKGVWDWKRPQHFSFSVRIEAAADKITPRLKLDNQDVTDKDNVCVVALFLNDRDEQVGVFYQNWLMRPKRSIARDVPLTPSPSAASVETIAVGVKQCEAGAGADNANYQRTRQRLVRN